MSSVAILKSVLTIFLNDIAVLRSTYTPSVYIVRAGQAYQTPTVYMPDTVALVCRADHKCTQYRCLQSTIDCLIAFANI